MATLREVQKQQTRQLLLDTGLELFESKGYAATTIDDIAAGAGTTRTTFYLHFASKAQLMGEVVKTVDAILTSVDDPSLSTVVELGKRDLVRTLGLTGNLTSGKPPDRTCMRSIRRPRLNPRWPVPWRTGSATWPRT